MLATTPPSTRRSLPHVRMGDRALLDSVRCQVSLPLALALSLPPPQLLTVSAASDSLPGSSRPIHSQHPCSLQTMEGRTRLRLIKCLLCARGDVKLFTLITSFHCPQRTRWAGSSHLLQLLRPAGLAAHPAPTSLCQWVQTGAWELEVSSSAAVPMVGGSRGRRGKV